MGSSSKRTSNCTGPLLVPRPISVTTKICPTMLVHPMVIPAASVGTPVASVEAIKARIVESPIMSVCASVIHLSIRSSCGGVSIGSCGGVSNGASCGLSPGEPVPHASPLVRAIVASIRPYPRCVIVTSFSRVSCKRPGPVAEPSKVKSTGLPGVKEGALLRAYRAPEGYATSKVAPPERVQYLPVRNGNRGIWSMEGCTGPGFLDKWTA